MENRAFRHWALKAMRLLPLLIIASMLLAACGAEALTGPDHSEPPSSAARYNPTTSSSITQGMY